MYLPNFSPFLEHKSVFSGVFRPITSLNSSLLDKSLPSNPDAETKGPLKLLPQISPFFQFIYTLNPCKIGLDYEGQVMITFFLSIRSYL